MCYIKYKREKNAPASSKVDLGLDNEEPANNRECTSNASALDMSSSNLYQCRKGDNPITLLVGMVLMFFIWHSLRFFLSFYYNIVTKTVRDCVKNGVKSTESPLP